MADWSTLVFPLEDPPKDFKLWREALHQVFPAGGLMDALGRCSLKRRKIWDWPHNNKTYDYFTTTTEPWMCIFPLPCVAIEGLTDGLGHS